MLISSSSLFILDCKGCWVNRRTGEQGWSLWERNYYLYTGLNPHLSIYSTNTQKESVTRFLSRWLPRKQMDWSVKQVVRVSAPANSKSTPRPVYMRSRAQNGLLCSKCQRMTNSSLACFVALITDMRKRAMKISKQKIIESSTLEGSADPI